MTTADEQSVSGSGGSESRRVADSRHAGISLWTNSGALDRDGSGSPREEWSSARWLGEFQNDFAARLQWSVQPNYAGANHHPSVAVEEGLELTRSCSEVVELHALASDPDGDEVTVAWWQYREAGTSRVELELQQSRASVTFRIPDDANPGESFHVICTVRDLASIHR